MTRLQRISFPNRIFCVAATNTGYIYLETREDWYSKDATFICYDLSGSLLWEKTLSSPTPCLLKVAFDSVWIGSGTTLYQFELDGTLQNNFSLDWIDNRILGSFVVHTDGFYVCSVQSDGYTYQLPDKAVEPQILHYSLDGTLRWTVNLPINPIEYDGVIEAGTHTNWNIQPKQAWQPRDWRPDGRSDPILLSDDRLIVSYVEYSSGVGVTYCLNTENGGLLWTTSPQPLGTRAFSRDGHFLIGAQGYGAFDTWLYDGDGTTLNHWPSHGNVVIAPGGEIRVVEMENVLPSRMHFSVFEPTGEVRKGPHLKRYYTTYPVLDSNGTTFFWRDGELIAVDDRLEKHVLYAEPTTESYTAVLSQALIPNTDKLVFSRDNEIWVFETECAQLANSVWPCASGNLGGNPIFSSQRQEN